jgi:hypothetical protein
VRTLDPVARCLQVRLGERKKKRGSIVVLTGQFKVVALLVVRVTNCKEKKAVLRILHGVVSAILESISVVVATSAGRNTCGLFE